MTWDRILKDAEPMMHLVQALALILGGCWVLASYVAHNRAIQELSKEQAQLHLEADRSVEI